MGFGGSPPAPQAPIAMPLPPALVNPATASAVQANRQRGALAGGRNSTILTNPQGLGDKSLFAAKKSVLGM